GHLRGLPVRGDRSPRGPGARMIPFAKGHGLGNDYIVMNEADLPRPLDTRAIERVCDRNWGVGSDGILLKVPSSRADFGLRIFNPDGSEAEKSGNGLRIFAKYLWDHGDARGRATFRVDTKGGIVECTCHVRDGRMSFVTLDILIWERGAGYTLASGSSSCGAASAAVKNGLCRHGRVTVRMPGGTLVVEVRPDWSLRLEGPVEEVYTGTLTAEFARDWLGG